MARQERSEQTREAFIAAALNLCREGGPEAVSARRLGRLLGLSQMAVYRHFQDMEELMAHAWDRAFRELLTAIEPVLTGCDSHRDLHRGLMAYVRFGLENPGLYRLMFFHHFSRSEVLENQNTGLEGLDLLRNVIGRCLREQGGAVSDPDLHGMALQAWFSIHGLTTAAISGRFGRVSDEEPVDVASGQVERLCRSFLLPRPDGSVS